MPLLGMDILTAKEGENDDGKTMDCDGVSGWGQ
jgi:hypothetical protein